MKTGKTDNADLTFCRLSVQEARDVFSLVTSRIAWMDAQGLVSWNTTYYLERYPLSYFETMAGEGTLYGLLGPDGRILSAGVLLREDERWPDDAEAVYLHNFVSAADAPGAGSAFLEKAERQAAENGIVRFRLDVADGNAVMNRYYESRGYVAKGTCSEGPYQGILREKCLTAPQV